MPCVSQAIWLMSEALNAPVSETRGEMRMVAERVEELEALEIVRELTSEELSELEELKEEVLRDASSTALRLDLRGDMIETLTLDYEVEYDNYGLTQRFDLMNRIVEVIAEVPSTSLDAASSFFLLWVNLSKAYEDEELNTAALRMPSFLSSSPPPLPTLTHPPNVGVASGLFGSTYSSFSTRRRDNEGTNRPNTQQMDVSLSTIAELQQVIDLQVPLLVTGAPRFELDASFFVLYLAKVYSSSLLATIPFYNNTINITLPSSVVLSLPDTQNLPSMFSTFKTGQDVYVYQGIVYLSNPYNFSTSSQNITTPVFSFRIFANGTLLLLPPLLPFLYF